MYKFFGRNIIWIILIMGIALLPVLIFSIRFISMGFTISNNPDDWYKLLNIIYSKLILIATSLIGYFAFRYNTINPYLEKYITVYNDITQNVNQHYSSINIKIFRKNYTGTKTEIQRLIQILNAYKKENQFLFPSIVKIIDTFTKRLWKSDDFFQKFLLDEFEKQLPDEQQKLNNAFEDFMNNLKNSMIKIN